MGYSTLYNMNRTRPVSGVSADLLLERLTGARSQLRALVDCLPSEAWLGPRAAHLNPPLWEYGHVVWFQERWCLREWSDGSCGDSVLAQADALYDSSNVPHDTRWDLPLLDPAAIDAYGACVTDAVATRLRTRFDNEIAYFAELCLYHELMHIEAWWMAFQDLGYAPPAYPEIARVSVPATRLTFPPGEVTLGSNPEAGFAFDNEKWAHVVPVAAFDIDANLASETAFRAFIDAGGYTTRSLWSDAGWAWRVASEADHPRYWRRAGDGWQVRRFERWLDPNENVPVLHVNRYEAEAFAAWQARRLPSAAEWLRATTSPDFRWGGGWEWLREAFAPYAGFVPDPYRDYSQPWFHTHGELRGGGPVTDGALKRPGFRNFYLPERRDAFAGFRTAAAV